MNNKVTGITAYNRRSHMNSIVYVGMDVHKEQYTLCCYGYDTDKVEYKQQTIPLWAFQDIKTLTKG